MSSTSSRPVWEYASRKHEQAAALYLKTHHARQKPSFSFRMTRAFCIFTDGTDDIQVFTSRKNNSHEMQECRRLSHYPYKVSGLSRPATPRHESDDRSTEDDDFLAAVPPSRCRDGPPGHRPDYKEMFPADQEPYSQPAVHFRIRAAFPTGRVLSWEQYRFIQIPQRHHSTLKTDVHCRTVTRLSLIDKQT